LQIFLIPIDGTKFIYQSMTVKLPCFGNHPADAGGILNEQSAILQLQKRKELHHEKEKHFSKPKSTITSSV
jgi:hypothetical protein